MTNSWLDPTSDPAPLFDAWYQDAIASEPNDPNAMTLATIGPDGMPSARIVLLKAHDADGFVFFTNYQSRKADELGKHHQAALCFHWKSRRRQVRIEGVVAPVDATISDAYFAQRHRISQIGAWASLQSRPLPDRATFERRIADYESQYPREVPRPPHWGGYRLSPRAIEFWQELEFRLHDRVVFTREAGKPEWYGTRLYP